MQQSEKIVNTTKRKRQERKAEHADESDTSKENDRRKIAPRFRKQHRGNAPRHFSFDMNKEKQTKESNDEENDSKENVSNNE